MCLCVWLAATSALASAQVNTGTVLGGVKDSQGAVVPGAVVTLISEARDTRSAPASTNDSGEFVIANVSADTYTLEIALESFKTSQRSGIAVSPGDRIDLGTFVLEIGGATETVLVRGEAPRVQSNSGERSFSVTGAEVTNLPIATRNFADLINLTPGVVNGNRAGDSASTGGGANNFMMDGVSTMEPGSNRLMVAVNVESIAEVKVLTSSYQAEYGRSSGLQVAAVTKSGTNQLHGSLYDVERNSDWNSNSRTNVLNGDPKPTVKQRDWGFSIGGPVGKPGRNNKLFFFYAQEFQPRTTGNNVVRFRVPTELERRGDFSQTVDNNGNPFPYIKDPLVTGTCSATNQAACFADGGVLGRIPANRLYDTGLNILKLYPMPTLGPGQPFNFELRRPEQSLTAWQPVVRVDYQPVTSLRGTFKYAAWGQPAEPILGSIPGFNDTQMNDPVVPLWSATVNYTLNPSTFLEGSFGNAMHRQAGCGLNGGGVNFCTAGFPVNPAANQATNGLAGLPRLFPGANVVDSSFYQYEALTEVGPANFDGTRVLLAPAFQWGNRVANAPPNLVYPGFADYSSVNDVAASITKLFGRHTVKAGYYRQTATKRQNQGNPFGTLNFGNDAANPLDSGFGFANAALGVFSSYAQASRFVEGQYTYTNDEFYIQDNWRVNDKLTLDYGMRFVHQVPQYDTVGQASNFLPEDYNRAAAPLQYVAGCANGIYPCSGTNRQAMHPVTGQLLGPGSTVAIGALIPNTGDTTNGIFVSGQGIAKTTFEWPALRPAPRFGMAYDVTGAQTVIIRGGAGLFFDRPSGNSVFAQVLNPPNLQNVTVRYAQLQSLGGGLTTQSPPALNVFEYESELPSTIQWNAGVQLGLPGAMALDVAYVGQHQYDILQQVNLNRVDFGAAFLPENRDPSLAAGATPGATAISTDLMRAYRGYGSIVQTTGWLNRTYHSIQLSIQRRFTNGLSFGFNDTIGLYDRQNTTPRQQHGADGSVSVRADQAEADRLLGDNNPAAHIMKANFVWDLPDVQADSSIGRVFAALANDWQLAGIWTAATGGPYSATHNYQSGGNVNITGSPDYGGRLRIVGDTGSGCSDDPHRQFNTAAFLGPLAGSDGLESPNNYLRSCFFSAFDFSLQRTINLGGGRAFQFRVDVFNAFDEAAITGRNGNASFANTTNPTNIANLPFDASGNLIANRSLPRNAGFGVANAYQAPRQVQLQLRFRF